MRIVLLLSCGMLMTIGHASAQEPTVSVNAGETLPSAANFIPDRYLGKWYEVARLPTATQPDDTLAIAEYSKGNDGRLSVKNSAYSADGKLLSTVEGEARLAPGNPPGRLLVSFGPALPANPNYYVLYVDEAYRHAVVGVPDRQSLWILAREAPVPAEKLDELTAVARQAGFDTSKLLVANWGRATGQEADQAPRTTEATETERETPLKTLEWLVGSWTGNSENGSIEFSCGFTKNNAFLIRSFRIMDGSNVKMSGMQVIAWDPAQKSIRSWTYDSDGGFGEDVWSQANDHYTMRAKYTLPDGGTGSALHVMRYVDDDTFILKSTNREIDGELLPNTAEIVVSRVETSAPAATDPSADGGTN